MRILFYLYFLMWVSSATAQEENELDKRNGFKDIKLGASIDSVKGARFKKDIKEKHAAAQVYEVVHPDYESIGEVKVFSVEVKTYKKLIYEISVVTEKDPRLMKAMESVLGKPVYNMRDESYNWATKKLALRFRSRSKKELELIYISYVVHAMMREDKDKKIDDIADDF